MDYNNENEIEAIGEVFSGKRLSSGKMLLSPYFKETVFYSALEKTNEPNTIRLWLVDKSKFDNAPAWYEGIDEYLKEDVNTMIENAKKFEGKVESTNSFLIPVTEYAYKEFDDVEVRDALEQTLIQVLEVIEFTKEVLTHIPKTL